MAGTTGLEPAASAVTGQRSNQLNYVPSLFDRVSGNPVIVHRVADVNRFHPAYRVSRFFDRR
jgi:hypothetical protein